MKSWAIDYGRCTRCQECLETCPAHAIVRRPGRRTRDESATPAGAIRPVPRSAGWVRSRSGTAKGAHNRPPTHLASAPNRDSSAPTPTTLARCSRQIPRPSPAWRKPSRGGLDCPSATCKSRMAFRLEHDVICISTCHTESCVLPQRPSSAGHGYCRSDILNRMSFHVCGARLLPIDNARWLRRR